MDKILKEKLIQRLFLICALSSIGIVFSFVAIMIVQGSPILSDWFLNGFGMIFSAEEHGILSYTFATLYVGIGAAGVATVIGLPCAIHLAEFADRKVRNIIKPSLEMLTGLPSVVMGMFGAILILSLISIAFNLQGPGYGAMAAWILLGIMSLPHVASISEDAMNSVPNELREAALSMGATKWQTTLRVVLPVAKRGILTAIILGMGNAIGETMAVMFIIGRTYIPPLTLNPLVSTDVLPSLIAGHSRPDSTDDPLLYPALLGAGFVLFLLIAALNLAARNITKQRKKATTKEQT